MPSGANNPSSFLFPFRDVAPTEPVPFASGLPLPIFTLSVLENPSQATDTRRITEPASKGKRDHLPGESCTFPQ